MGASGQRYRVEGRRNTSSREWYEVEASADEATAKDYLIINIQLGWAKYRARKVAS